MDPPEDGKISFANELYGESLHLSEPGDEKNLTLIVLGKDENVDGSFYGDSDEEEPSDALAMERESELRRKQYHSAGYRDGIIAGKEAAAQEGYNIGYKESVLSGYKFGIVRGVSSALAFLPDELREKLIEEQETRDGFQELHNSVSALSTDAASKLFYKTLTSNQVEEQRGDEGGSSSVTATTDLGSYVTKLSSLLEKSPKIEVKLEI